MKKINFEWVNSMLDVFLPIRVLLLLTVFMGFFSPLAAVASVTGADAAKKENFETPVDGGRILFGSIGEASNLIPYLSADSASHEVAGLIFSSPR